jgi:putative phage-type endonuclease
MLTQKQHEARRHGIGASDAASVLGIDPWRTPLELWLEKVGLAQKQDDRFGTPMYWGNLLESAVADAYQDLMGVKVRKSLITLKHRQHDFIICHLDRKIEGQRKILECKTSFSREKWGEPGTDEVPFNYLIQVQHQMAVTGYDEADIAVLISGNEFRYYTIQRDEDIIRRIVEAENEFWYEHVLSDLPPEPSCRKDAQLLYAGNNELVIDADYEVADAVEQLSQLKSQSKENERNQEKLEDKITLFMKEATSLQYFGKEIVSWKADKNGKRQLRIKI